jgi:hypothetical protein
LKNIPAVQATVETGYRKNSGGPLKRPYVPKENGLKTALRQRVTLMLVFLLVSWSISIGLPDAVHAGEGVLSEATFYVQ